MCQIVRECASSDNHEQEMEGVALLEVDRFCYLGDVIDCEAGVEKARDANTEKSRIS